MAKDKYGKCSADDILISAWGEFLRSTPDMVFLKDSDLIYIGASLSFARMVGLSSADELIGKTDFDIFKDKELAEQYRKDDQTLLDVNAPLLNYIEPLPSGDSGFSRFCSTSKFPVRDSSGNIIGLCGMSRDITREYQLQTGYERELKYLALRGDSYVTALFDVSSWKIVRYEVNERLAGNAPRYATVDEYIRSAADSVVSDEDVRAFLRGFTREAMLKIYDSGRRTLEMEYLRAMPDGSQRWVRDEMRFLANPVEGHVMFYFALRDVDAERREEGRFSRAAESDPLTGLLSSDAAMRRISRYIESEGGGGVHALFVIDIDNFKKVNELFGRQTGDEIIASIASAIKNVFRDTDIVGRVHEDEFIALMKNAGGLRAAVKKASDLVETMQFDYCTESGKTSISGSVGVSVCGGDGETFDRLYTEADNALYRAKSQGKSKYCFANTPDGCLDEDGSFEDESSGVVHLRTLLEDIEGAVYIIEISPAGGVKVVYTSPSTFRTFKRKLDYTNASAYSPLGVVLPEDLEPLLAEVRSAAESGGLLDYTYRVLAADGVSVEWRHARGSLTSKNAGGVRRMLCVVTDITAIKRQREELAARYERVVRMRDSIDSDAIGSFEMNLTKNTCGNGHTINDYMLTLQEPGTADGFFDNIYAHCADSSGLERVRAGFSRKALMDAYERGESVPEFEFRFMVEPDRAVWIRTGVVTARNPETRDIECYVFARNIEDEKTMRMLVNKFVDLEYEFATLVNAHTGKFSFVKAPNAGITMLPMDGEDYDRALARDLPNSVVGDEAGEALEALSLRRVIAELEKSDNYSCSFSLMSKDGRIERKQWNYTYIDENRTLIACTRRDVTDVYMLEMDPVTGILNRTGFCRAVRKMLDENPDTDFFISRLDIDHFKVYNDIYGKQAGDALLAAVGKCYRDNAKQPTVYGRLEGDHFVTCAPIANMDAERGAALVTDALNKVQPDFSFVVRSGIYKIQKRSTDVNIMCDRALMALRSTKGRYDTVSASYEASMRSDMIEKQKLLASVKSALANEEFGVHIQPQYDQTTGRVVGAEALARWFHDGKVVPPDKFIPVFEENGFIIQLDEYIWEHVCRLLRRWLDEGRSVVPISVNVSRFDIYNTNLRAILGGLVKKYNLSPGLLRLEITETAYTEEPAQLMDTVKELRSDGFFVEMDDFGSGYSSLNMFKDIIVDMVKLDMKFLSSDKDDQGRSGLILNAIVRLTRWLSIPVIAEGVETTRQADFLKTIGCNLAQGYLYAKPMPVEDFEQLLEDGRTGGLSTKTITTSHFNNDEFWNIESQATVIFNSFVGASCIVEYKGEELELLRANDKYYEETGLSRDDAADMQGNMLLLALPEDRPIIVKALRSAIVLDGEREASCEARWSKAGDPITCRWLRTRMRVIARSVDRYVFYATVEDITRRKKMERVMLSGAEELRIAMSQMDIVTASLDIPSRTITIPEKYARKHGSPQIVPGMPRAGTFYILSDTDAYVDFYERAIKGEKTDKLTALVKNADGTSSWEELTAATIFGIRGKPQRVVITVRDVTLEMRLRAEEEREKLFVDVMGSVVFEYDYESDTLDYSADRGEGMEKLRVDHYLENLCERDAIHPDFIDSFRQNYIDAQKAPMRGTFEYRANYWNTGYRWCRAYYASVAYENGRVRRVTGLIYDIQEERDKGWNMS